MKRDDCWVGVKFEKYNVKQPACEVFLTCFSYIERAGVPYSIVWTRSCCSQFYNKPHGSFFENLNRYSARGTHATWNAPDTREVHSG